MMDTLRDAIRSLRRSPGFVLLTVGILAIGVGLNATMFAVVDCVLLRPLGYHDADRIVALQTHFLDKNRAIPRLGGGDYVDLAEQTRGIESAAFYTNWSGAVQVRGESAKEALAYVSPRFGEVLSVEPIAGRLFRAGHGEDREALVSAAFARDHFASSSASVGQPVRGENGQAIIVGVLPDGFNFPGATRVWFEQPEIPENLNRTSYSKSVIAKRREGVSAASLAAELSTLSAHLQAQHVEDKNKAIEAIALQERVVGRIAPTLHLLMGAVAVLLLIVCANITHLQLVRATRQIRELAVRSALGASRARLAARALLEAALLSVAGCAGALLLAVPALRLLVHMAPVSLPRLNEVQLNWHVLADSLAISFVLMGATALLPVWRSWHVDQSLVLRQDSARGLEGRGAVRLRSAFLVAQVACTLVLAAAAVLLARQLVAQSREDLGFNMAHVYTLDANMVEAAPALELTSRTTEPVTPEAKAAAEHAQQALDSARLARLSGALETLRSTPGVLSAEAMDGTPLGFSSSDVGYAIQGKQTFAPPYRNLPNADVRPVTPGALALLQVPLLRGRALSESDNSSAPHVLLINHALAEEQFHGQDPIGHRIQCGLDSADPNDWWTIVGVVGDVKSRPGSPVTPTFYIPFLQHSALAGSMQFLVRTAPGVQMPLDALRQRLTAAHPDIAVAASSMEQNLSDVERELRFRTLLFESFAAVSILLAMLGMYGATAYTVTQRSFEFGLRMALGATREQVLLRVLRGSFWIALTGSCAGMVLYAGLLRISASLVGKLPSNPVTVLWTAVGVVLLSVLAAAVPARRASSVDPMRALRTE